MAPITNGSIWTLVAVAKTELFGAGTVSHHAFCTAPSALQGPNGGRYGNTEGKAVSTSSHTHREQVLCIQAAWDSAFW